MRREKVHRAQLARMAGYGRPYLRRLALVSVALVAIALLSVMPPLLVRDLIDVAIPSGSVARVTVIGVVMVAVPVLSGLLDVVQHWGAVSVGEAVIFDLRRQLLRHVHTMPLEFFTQTRTGELMARLDNDVLGAQQAVSGSLVTLVSGGVTAAVTVATMAVIDWRLTLLALAMLPVFYLVGRLIAGKLRNVIRQQMESMAGLIGILAETLNVSGALLVKLFGRKGLEEARQAAAAAELRELGIRRHVIDAWLEMALNLTGVVGVGVVFWIGSLLVVAGGVQVGDVVAIALLLGNLYRPLSRLATAPVEFAASQVAFERVFEVLDMRPAITDRPAATALPSPAGKIEFRDVAFRFTEGVGLAPARRYSWWESPVVEPAEALEAPESAVESLSFVARPGTLTALVGPSGAGKTTIANLIPRLYDATSGSVLIDGHDVRDLTLDSLRRSIGVVTQEAYLLHDTVVANLRYAKPGATRAELEAACRAARIQDVIAALPGGYDTVVGERGHRLSGGERQRLAIARVILKDARIVILDEATSHLDAQSEALVQEALETLWRGRTAVVIAHRLSTIVAADQILVIDRGRVVERGTHSDLIATDGLYARLYERQLGTDPPDGPLAGAQPLSDAGPARPRP